MIILTGYFPGHWPMNIERMETRREREAGVVRLMIGMYCRAHHHRCDGGLCEECRGLLDYSALRISRCPKGDSKRSCRVCEIHCYSPEMRTRIREVMRYAGPRMIRVAPLAALRHLWGELRGARRR